MGKPPARPPKRKYLVCGGKFFWAGAAYTDDVSAQTTTKLKSCPRCRKVAYCSTGCQQKDWKARHKHECGGRGGGVGGGMEVVEEEKKGEAMAEAQDRAKAADDEAEGEAGSGIDVASAKASGTEGNEQTTKAKKKKKKKKKNQQMAKRQEKLDDSPPGGSAGTS